MKQISEADKHTLDKTHTQFFNQHIKVETEFAFKVQVINNRGAFSSNWIPKSKIKFAVLKRKSQKPPHDMEEFKMYFAPNHFIR